jgi:acyl-CoA thioester hydrolase
LRKDYRTLVEETLNEAPGLSFVVRSVEIEFLKPAHMDDVLEILTTPIE